MGEDDSRTTRTVGHQNPGASHGKSPSRKVPRPKSLKRRSLGVGDYSTSSVSSSSRVFVAGGGPSKDLKDKDKDMSASFLQYW